MKKLHNKMRKKIEKRLREFRKTGRDENAMFEELVFCLLTPQSKARVCWRAVERLRKRGLLGSEDVRAIEKELTGVRFTHQKAKWISAVAKFKGKLGRLRSRFSKPGEFREWLVKNVKGLGYKEASHFIRNIGFSDELAILDRHILKNLNRFGVIEEIPKSLTKRRYLEIEKKMQEFSRRVGIPLSHLDLLFWAMETGEIFK